MKQKLTQAFTLTFFLMTLCAIPVFGQGTPIYNNIPNPLPGNLASWGYEATGTSEFGDRIMFAPATGHSLATVTATMSSWACQSGTWFSSNCATTPGATFSHPITLNIYNVVAGNQVGTLIGSVTQTFAIPYRPSVDLVNCTDGRWYESSSGTCFNGKASNITFNLSGLNVPNQVIFGIAYNTTHYGYAPIGQAAPCYSTSGGCPYDSLNVALADPAVYNTVGSNPAPNDAYQYTLYGSCTDGPIVPFGLDAGCWTGYKPSVRFNATNPPATKDDCKNGGWQTRTTTTGQPFRNQGQCVSSTNR